MNEIWLKNLAEFQTKFEMKDDPELWVKLVLEELAETKEAAAHLLKEIADLAYTTAGLRLMAGSDSEALRLMTEAGVSDFGRTVNELIDVTDQLGILDIAFDRVHASNMSKLDDDGKPVRREDGKVLKGPNYKPPVLDDLIV